MTMPSVTATSAVGIAAVLLMGSLAASQASLDMTEPFEQEIKQLMESTLRDVSVGWLEAKDAYGLVQDDEVHAVDLLVRLDGAARDLTLSELVITTDQGESVSLEGTKVLRDEDGSVEEGRLTQGDLVRLELVPEGPLPTGDAFSLIFHHPSKATLEVRLDTPDHPSDGQTRLRVTRSW